MALRSLYDNLNRRVELGPQINSGGEGAVFEVVGRPDSLAKVYHKPLDARGQQKLRLMASLARPNLLAVAAWPTATLQQTPHGPLVGLLMPRAPGKEVHQLYSPAHRKKEFPTADWAFLIQSAMNCAIAFDGIHRAGHTMADVNEKNVFVSPKGIVTLIDCDSYQINAEGQTFLCDVGVPLYTSPELQGQSFRGVIRTHNHDRFGLAVLIFHLLFVGRHPFSGRPLTKGELPIEKAIKEFRFAFSRAAAQLQIAPPPHAPLLSILPADVVRLFERAFSIHSAQPGARPTAQEWAAALSTLQKQLKVCAKDAGHKFPAYLGQCCWCELMQAGAPNYFISVAVFRLGTAVQSLTFVLGPAWVEIDRIPRPSTAYARPSLPASSRIAPTVLPAHIPFRVPPPIVVPRPAVRPAVIVPIPWVRPAIMVPASQVAPPIAIPREFLNKVVGWTALGSIFLLFTLFLGVLFVAIMVPPAFRPSPGGCGMLVPAVVFLSICTFIFGGVWFLLELKYQAAVRLADAERDASLDVIDRENARRKEAYETAVQVANAKRDAIVEAIDREKSREEEAYNAAVRLANAKRDAILAAMSRERAHRQEAYEIARKGLEAAEGKWQRTASAYQQSFDGQKKILECLKSDYLNLKLQYEQEYRELERNKEAAQKDLFLQTQFISDHDITGIGPTREAALRSNGVETAYDINQERISEIDGFGSVLTGNLLSWKQQVSSLFRFNAAAGVSPSELAGLVVKFKQFQQRAEAKLHAGLVELRECSDKAGRHLPKLYAPIPGLVTCLAQAKIDLQVLSGTAD
jgi:DNA-binding helix-hairpin-helix protein with protein kinase domain